MLRTRTGVAILVVTSALAATGCSSASKDKAATVVSSVAAGARSAAASVASDAGSAASSVAAGASSAASSLGSSAAAAAGDCDAAPLEVKAALTVSGVVTGVKLLGNCTTLSVETSLASDAQGAAVALGMCQIAAAQAYSHGVGAVSIEAADGKELAAGIKGASCIGEP